MALHFTTVEFSDRLRRLQAELASRELDGMLLFAQESMFWLTGYDTFGFCFFQCLYVGLDGRMALLTRSADLRQAQRPPSSRISGSGPIPRPPTRPTICAPWSRNWQVRGSDWGSSSTPTA